jgi:hypothetical protein
MSNTFSPLLATFPFSIFLSLFGQKKRGKNESTLKPIISTAFGPWIPLNALPYFQWSEIFDFSITKMKFFIVLLAII